MLARRRILLFAFSFATAAAPAGAGQGPYVVGSKADPHREVVEDRGHIWLGIEQRAELQYAERFAVDSVSLSADGRLVSAVGRLSRQGPKLWTVDDARPVTLPSLDGTVAAAAIDGRGEQLLLVEVADVMAGGEGGVRALDLGSGERSRLVVDGDGCRGPAWAPDGKNAACGIDENLVLIDLVKGRGEPGMALGGRVDGAAWASDRRLVVFLDGGAQHVEVDVEGPSEVERRKARRAEGPFAIAPGGAFVAQAVESTLELRPAGEEEPQTVELGARVTALAWSGNGRRIAAGLADGRILCFDVAGAESKPPPGHGPKGAEDEDRPLASPARKEKPPPKAAATTRERSPTPQKGGTAVPAGRAARLEDRDLRGSGDDDDEHEGGSVDLGRPEKEGAKSSEKEPSRSVEARYDIAIVEQMDGDPRTGDRMEAALRKNSRSLQGCFNRALKNGLAVEGRYTFDLGVSPEGEGVGIESPATDTVGNDKLLGCVVEKLRDSLFGPGLGSMDIRLVVELRVVETEQ